MQTQNIDEQTNYLSAENQCIDHFRHCHRVTLCVLFSDNLLVISHQSDRWLNGTVVFSFRFVLFSFFLCLLSMSDYYENGNDTVHVSTV